MTCTSCGARVPDGARFCPACGTPLAPRAMQGERRLVTLLFADVVGSTRLAERLDPEVWAEIMQGGYDLMTAAVEAFGGTVNRYVGDAVLALFGADVAHEDDPERAVRAALALQDQAADYGARLQADFGIDFQVRIGIDTGLVVLARVGDKSAPEAMGDVANVAARLQTLAAPGTVLIGGETHRLVAHLVEATPIGDTVVKGRSAAVAAHKVVGFRATRGSGRGLAGLRSPLVGRDGAYARLVEAVRALRNGRGGVITVIGEAGLGKSRLVAELRGTAAERAPEVRWFEGRGLSYASATPYFPWQQIVRTSIGAREGKPAADVRALLRQHRERRGLPEDALAFLETVLAVESEASRAWIDGLEREERVTRLDAALTAHLRSLAAAAPTVVVFEDLHWADGPSVDALVRVAPVVVGARLLILCVLRPERGEDEPGWRLVTHLRTAAPEWGSELVLDRLTDAESERLLGNLLFVEDLPDAVRRRILDRSEGNPFFIEEVIRDLLDAGVIAESDGRWRVVGDELDRVAIPDTLLGVLGGRIDRLPDATRRVLHTAAVIGRVFERRVLARVCAAAEEEERIDDVEPHLGRLVAEELLRPRAEAAAPEYAFKHALTQEAAYERLLLKRRREIHLRTGRVLEELHGDGDDRAALLAYHFANAEAWEAAARYALLAGRRSLAMFAADEALAHFASAVEALERLPEAAPGAFVDAILAWNDASVTLRRHERLETRQEMLARLARAEGLARELGDERRLARALVAKGNVLSLSGFPGEAFPTLLEANEMASALGDESLFLVPFFATTEAMVNRDPRGSLPQLDQVVALAHRHHDHGIEAHALAAKAMAHARLGQAEEARAAIRDALELVPRSRSLIKEADVHLTAGSVFYDLGEPETGLKHSVYGLNKALEGNGLECACAGYYFTGLGRLQTEELDDALAAFRDAAGLGESLGSMSHFMNLIGAGQALVRLANGDADAVPQLKGALTNAQRMGDEYGAAYVAHALGDAQVRAGDTAAGRELLNEALAYYRRRVMRPYEARVLRSLATAHEAEGRLDEALALRAEADDLTGPPAAPGGPGGPSAVPRGAADGAG